MEAKMALNATNSTSTSIEFNCTRNTSAKAGFAIYALALVFLFLYGNFSLCMFSKAVRAWVSPTYVKTVYTYQKHVLVMFYVLMSIFSSILYLVANCTGRFDILDYGTSVYIIGLASLVLFRARELQTGKVFWTRLVKVLEALILLAAFTLIFSHAVIATANGDFYFNLYMLVFYRVLLILSSVVIFLFVLYYKHRYGCCARIKIHRISNSRYSIDIIDITLIGDVIIFVAGILLTLFVPDKNDAIKAFKIIAISLLIAFNMVYTLVLLLQYAFGFAILRHGILHKYVKRRGSKSASSETTITQQNTPTSGEVMSRSS